MSGISETRRIECMKRVSVNVHLTVVFVIINVRMMINAGANAKN